MENSTPIDPAAELLNDAKRIVSTDRRNTYGTPEDNLGCTAAMWEAYLRRVTGNDSLYLTAADVAAMMVLVKVARLSENSGHRDSWLDTAGYAACGWRCAAPTPGAFTNDKPREPLVPGDLSPVNDQATWLKVMRDIERMFDPHHDTMVPGTMHKYAKILGYQLTYQDAEIMCANLSRPKANAMGPQS